jgi:hypothetical protein
MLGRIALFIDAIKRRLGDIDHAFVDEGFM